MQWAGTPAYMAPELFSKKRYAEPVDVFAFGTMIWEVAATELPHANLDPSDIAHRTQKQDGAGLPITHTWPKTLKNLINTTLSVEATSRPTMEKVARCLESVIMDLLSSD